MTLPVLILAVALAAPPPNVAAAKPAGDEVANTFAERMARLVPLIRDKHPKPASRAELVSAGAAGLFRAVGRPVPAEFRNLKDAELDVRETFFQARKKAGDAPELAGLRDFIHGANGFAAALDPSCVLTLAHNGPFSMSEQELLGGLEIDGISPIEWMVYRIESGPESNWRTAPPVPLPWMVKRVAPGLAAAAADLRPGDEILSIDGVKVQPGTDAKLLPPLLVPLAGTNAAEIGSAAGRKLRLAVRREGREIAIAFEVPRENVESLPRETVFGYARRADGNWDYFPNAKDRIAYLRLAGFDDHTPTSLARALNEIEKENPIGLLVDARWSPGGSLQSGGRAASPFFRDDQELAKVSWKDPGRSGEKLPRLPLGSVDELWQTLPLAVLINSETYGGGETLAGAMKDHKRGPVIGQRTSGRGLFYVSTNIDVAGLRYRITSGKVDYPSGRNRHRHENMGPLDEWGVRPDPGFEIPTTADFSKRLRDWHDRATIRPAGEANAVALDDPLNDTQRTMALRLFKESLAKKK